eukprot:scaffold9311_cov149-Skeletonema_menzelii.AAC.4
MTGFYMWGGVIACNRDKKAVGACGGNIEKPKTQNPEKTASKEDRQYKSKRSQTRYSRTTDALTP